MSHKHNLSKVWRDKSELASKGKYLPIFNRTFDYDGRCTDVVTCRRDEKKR